MKRGFCILFLAIKTNLRCSPHAPTLPGLVFGQLVNLVLEIDDDFLVFFLEDSGGLFGFEMDILEKFAQLQQFCVPLLVDFELWGS